MSKSTENYKLIKPDLNESADINIINNNMDIIDKNLKESYNKIVILNGEGELKEKVNKSDFDVYKGEYNTYKSEVKSSLDDLKSDETRLTKAKDITGSINELFTNANNGKQNWVDVIGSPLVNGDSFSTLKSKTQNLKDTLASNLTNKEQSSNGSESLQSLISKVGNIQTKIIKSSQSGVTYIPSGNSSDGASSKRVYINSVNFKNSIIIRSLVSGNKNIGYMWLINGYTLEINKGNKGGDYGSYGWSVMEFKDNVKIQRGLVDMMGKSSSLVTIEKVNIENCLIFCTGDISVPEVNFTDDTHLSIFMRMENFTSGGSVYYHVVEFL